MSNRKKLGYPRSLDLLCGDAWDLGYASAQVDAAEGTVTENPYTRDYDDEVSE